jgi:hypothetical protein
MEMRHVDADSTTHLANSPRRSATRGSGSQEIIESSFDRPALQLKGVGFMANLYSLLDNYFVAARSGMWLPWAKLNVCGDGNGFSKGS